jgi:hypothetical protein
MNSLSPAFHIDLMLLSLLKGELGEKENQDYEGKQLNKET